MGLDRAHADDQQGWIDVHAGGQASGGLLLESGLRETYDDHLSRVGTGLLTGAEVTRRAEALGLRGRGGAGFPCHVKMRTVADQNDPIKWVVANGEEGEPGSAKDRYLLRHRPHLVLDGLHAAATAVGAQHLGVYVSDDVSAASVRAALDERPEPMNVRIQTVAHTYVAGEETALVQAFAGKRAVPRDKPPRPFEEGVDRHPTLVQNVETLAVLALAARQVDVAAARGETFLATVTGAGTAGCLYEVHYGRPTRALLGLHAQSDQLAGALVGGLFGGVLPVDALDLPMTVDDYRAVGAGLGCGAFHLITADDCPLDVVRGAMILLAAASARQCGVCLNGTAALRDVIGRIATARGTDADLRNMRRWATRLPGRGACSLLDASCAQARSLLRHYEPLIAAHLQGECQICQSHPDGDVDRLRLAG